MAAPGIDAMKHTPTFLTALLLALPAWLHAAEFHVAPTGNDANPGTMEKPFATLERARDAARKLKDPKLKAQNRDHCARRDL